MEPTIWLQAFAHMANRVNGRNAKARVSRGANEAMNLKRQEKNYLKTGPKRLRGSNGREYSQWVEAGDKIPHLVKVKDYIGSQECVEIQEPEVCFIHDKDLNHKFTDCYYCVNAFNIKTS